MKFVSSQSLYTVSLRGDAILDIRYLCKFWLPFSLWLISDASLSRLLGRKSSLITLLRCKVAWTWLLACLGTLTLTSWSRYITLDSSLSFRSVSGVAASETQASTLFLFLPLCLQSPEEAPRTLPGAQCGTRWHLWPGTRLPPP